MKTRLTPACIDAMIKGHEFLRPIEGTLTVCVLTLHNGANVIGTSNVIDSANYDPEIGEQVALENAKGKIWELEGYALKRDIARMPMVAAKVAHEMNRMYCEELGDTSQVPWDQAPDWQKESAYQGALVVMEHPDVLPVDLHASWLKHKEDDGWVYGSEKDPEKKTHPCMVPYDKLPPEQQKKDLIFNTVCKAILA